MRRVDEIFSIELNYVPPPKANRYLTAKNGKRFLPANIREAIDNTILLFQQAYTHQEPYSDYVEVHILFYLRKRRIDIDNIMKTIGDCLQNAGIITDDTLIAKKVAEKILADEERVVIRVFPFQIKKLLNPLSKSIRASV